MVEIKSWLIHVLKILKRQKDEKGPPLKSMCFQSGEKKGFYFFKNYFISFFNTKRDLSGDFIKREILF